MIRIEDLTEDDKKRTVRYTAYDCIEFGRITSWNGRFIFVCYHLRRFADGSEVARTGMTSEATRPEDLEFCS